MIIKELSTEEKAKAYDIALAKIKMLLGTGSNCSREELEYVFPELKESKDERIRNLIYCLIRDRSDSKKLLEHNGVSVDEALAWLEKQGQNPAWSEEDKNMLEWVIGYLENKMLNTPISEERTACKNAIAWLEEKLKGEQKPNPCDGCINRKGCINCENGELRETEQKPWSEEDDRMCKAIIDNIKAICEEGYFVGDIGSDKLINWLNSLRFQKQWKPSDEQIRILELVIDYWKPNDVSVTTPLYNLLEQLKKLKE